MRIYVVTITWGDKMHDVEVFRKREHAVSTMIETVRDLNGKTQNPVNVGTLFENTAGEIYKVRYGDVVSEIFEREI